MRGSPPFFSFTRFQPLLIAFVSVSLVGHAICVWGAFQAYDPVFYPFFLELAVCIVFSAIGSAVSALVPYREQFRFVHVLKVVAVVMVLRLNVGDAAAVDFIVVSVLFAELALFEELRWAALCVGAELILCCVLGLTDQSLSEKACFSFFTISFFGVMSLMVHYRNRTIEADTVLRNYSNAFKKIAESNLDLQSYAAQSERASAEQERRKISGALHDSIGYALTNIIAASSAIELLVESDPAQAKTLARSTCELSTNCLREVRQSLRVLRTVKEESPVLIKAIMKAVAVFEVTTGVKVEFNYGNLPWGFKNRALNQTLYRLVQEGMTNAFRHGKADFIRITMWKTDEELFAQIWDNGRGSETLEEGLGITDLRERIQDLGGNIEIRSKSDGFSLLVFVPLYEQDAYEDVPRIDR